MEGLKGGTRAPLTLDWDRLLPSRDAGGGGDDDDDLPQLFVATTIESWHEKHYPKNTQPEPSSTASPPPQRQPPSQWDDDHQIKMMSDQDLNYCINRKRQHVNNLGHKLPDKGAKLKARVDQLEAEKERRRQRRLNPDANECEILSQSESPIIIGLSNESQRDYPVPKNNSQPSFCPLFSAMIEQKNESSRIVNSFDKELSHLGQCGHTRNGLKGDSSQKRRRRRRISSRSNVFQSPTTLSSATDKRMRLNVDHRGASCLSHRREKLTSSLTKRIAAVVQSSHDSRLKKKFVLVDEEEPQFVETTQAADEKFILVDEEPHLVETIQKADELSQCMAGKKIYYPSRDDPESVEICYEDIKCLEPEAYLSSTIMNYYIRYLQQLASQTDEAWCDYHIFNTYFYRKLQEAVSNRSDKENFFAKFRRWWKGVNIFQKAYILIPVHENLHWSLVIVSIPDKDDESGPIILHMDSLRLHCSKSIFSNIKSYLSDEWSYLSQKLAPPDVPLAERIWMQLPSRIVEKIIPVPQQKNEYDCGLFVLLFMELFIKGAPQRLKSNGLEMFGRHWFKPEQASRLRGKIRELITEEFKIASL